MKIRQTALVLALLLLLSCFGCGSKEQTEQQQTQDQSVIAEVVSDGKFTLNYSPDASLNPYTTTSELNRYVGQLAYETLTVVDGSFNVQPGLFTEWSSEDGMTWTFKVDTKRTFHDGHTMSAADAAYSIQCAMESDNYSMRLRHVTSAESGEEEGTVVVEMDAANTQLPVLLNIPVIGNNSVGMNIPSGTGPYRFASDGKSLSVFADHPNASKMPVETIELASFPNMEDIVNAFSSGTLDLVCNDPTGAIDLGFGTVSEARQYSTTNLQYIGFNTNGMFFLSSERRAAFTRLIDRAYAVAMLNDSAVASPLPFHPVSPYYDEALAASMTYDPEVGKKMLEQAKIVDYDGDGRREFLPGDDESQMQEISLTFLVCSDSTQKTAIANKIAGDLDGLGISVTVKSLPWEEYLATLNAGNFDMYYGEVRLGADFDLAPLLSPGGAVNFGGISTTLFSEANTTYLASGDDTRSAAAKSLLQLVADHAPIIPVCFEKHEVCAHRGIVGGFVPTQYNIFNNLTEWVIQI